MTREEKRQIVGVLSGYIAKMGSQNKASNALKVSAATVSKMMNDEWDTIADEMWRKVGAALGHDGKTWQVVETVPYKQMLFHLDNAKSDSMVIAVTGFAGCGKTEAIKTYSGSHENVYHLMCSEYWNRPTFIKTLLSALGKNVGGTTGEQMDVIIDTLKKSDAPLIILDEADKLRDQVLYFFITLYNQLEGHCGIVMCATDYLQRRIERGLRINKKGYQEIYSRIGRRFVEIPVINDGDIAAVCMANGVSDAKQIASVVADADNDLRRVKRRVWALKKGGAL